MLAAPDEPVIELVIDPGIEAVGMRRLSAQPASATAANAPAPRNPRRLYFSPRLASANRRVR
jgi:hypothetical protein